MSSTTTSVFPVLHAVTRLAVQTTKSKKKSSTKIHIGDQDDGTQHGTLHNNSTSCIYDVKFYPYAHADEEPVFAVVAAKDIYVYRPIPDTKEPLEVLRVFRDPKDDPSLNSIVWSQDIETGEPLLCFGGAGSGNIRVVNIIKEKFIRSLVGHGDAINDLAISPLSPTILASASADYSIRIWNLDPTFERQPCAAILASPDAHKQPVLALAFHSKGKYLLSGGIDTMINLWPVPTVPDQNAGTDHVTRVYFPVFSSTEVHADYVDCLCFHGDLILSRAATTSSTETKLRPNSILLWKIDGFSSAAPVPDPPMATPGQYTRSGFGGRFQRLLTFDAQNTDPFYMRFSLFDQLGHRPILVMGDEKSKFSFWDLQSLEAAQGPTEAQDQQPRKYNKRHDEGRRWTASKSAPSTSVTSSHNKSHYDDDYDTADEDDDNDDNDNVDHDDNDTRHTPRQKSLSTVTPTATTPSRASTIRSPLPRQVRPLIKESYKEKAKSKRQKSKESRYDITDPFKPIPPHHTLTVPKYNFTVRQVAWSFDGRWCVAVGEIGVMVIMRRW